MKRTAHTRRWPLVGAAAILAFTLAACGEEDGTDESGSDPAPTSEATTEPGTEPGTETGSEPADPGTPADWAPEVVTDGDLVTGLDFSGTSEPPTELLVETLVEGDGPPVEVGQNITANYFGAVYGSDTPFDESYSAQPFTAPIGVGRLIPGWDQTIPGVTVGSRILMSIPSDLGYGDQGAPPDIPGGATLVFVIDIIDAA